MLGKTPEPFDAVDVIFGTRVDHVFRVLNGVMFAEALQRIVTLEFVGVVHRSFPGFLSNDLHQFVGRDTLNDPRVDPAIAFQKAKHNAFALGATTSSSFASAAKIALVKLDLARQFAALQFRHMVDHFAQALVDSRDRLIINTQIMRELVGRLRLVEALEDAKFSAELPERLLFSTAFISASHVATASAIDLERTAENTLSTPQKVGLTTENVLLTSNHEGILTPRGYESH